jgi:UDP-glucuronate decarboxylase
MTRASVAETLFHDFNKRLGVDIRIARIFNTYGPGMSPGDGRVVTNFIVLRLLECTWGLQRPVNLGNNDEITIGELADLVVSLTGSASKISYLPTLADDPRQRRPDISLARKKLGWSPTTKLTDGLMRTIYYFEARLSASGGLVKAEKSWVSAPSS